MDEDVAPTALETLPAEHSVHLVDPELDAYVPEGHTIHEEAPTALEAVPAGHVTQLLVPETYVPAGQVVEVSLQDEAPVVEY